MTEAPAPGIPARVRLPIGRLLIRPILFSPLLIGLLLFVALAVSPPTHGAPAGDDAWERQWRHVLGRMQDEARAADARAEGLFSEASRLRDLARQRLARTPDGDLHAALADYDRAQLAFDKARQATRRARTRLGDVDATLRHSTPIKQAQLDADLRADFGAARRDLRVAASAMRAGADAYNAGLRRLDDVPGDSSGNGHASGHDGLIDFIRWQSQEKAFTVTRDIARTRSALIELRDQAARLTDPGCESDLRARYRTALDELLAAQRAYLDADGDPGEADARFAEGDAALARARATNEQADQRFTRCLRRGR